ncbi:MAG: ArnT family glycosyltransferase [Thermoleophilia bacterium]
MNKEVQHIKTRDHLTRDLTILVITTLLLTVPFINMAFHWDDRDFIEQARIASKDPLKFHFEDYSSRGRFFETYPFRHPPFISWYLAPVLRAGGESEPLLHGAYLVFPLIATLSMYSLSRRFTRQPLVASLLFTFSPGFIVMSHTLMGNLPGVSFWLLASALFVWGVDRSEWKLLVASGFAAAASIMIFAQGLTLFPILFTYVALKRKFSLRILIAFLIPAVIYASWRFYFSSRYGHPPAISYQVDFNAETQMRSLIVFIGGSIIFPLAMIVAFLRRKIDLLIAFALIPPLVTWASFYYIAKSELTLVQGIQVAILAVAGFCIIYGLLSRSAAEVWKLIKNRSGSIDAIFLLVWFLGVAAIYAGTTTMPFVAIRHLLPLFAPVILLFARETESLWPRLPRLRTIFILSTLALTLAGGLAASIADYRLAGIYRSVAMQAKHKYADSPVKVWTLGEFGMRYYMEKEGFENLGVNSVASPGDVVFYSEVSGRGVVAPLPEGFYRRLSQCDVEDGFPVRSMNPWSGAGFYGNLMGPVPFTMGTGKLDEISENELYWLTEEPVMGGV